MISRFKQLRKQLGLSQDEFANRLGLKSRGKIANIEFGKVPVDESFLSLVCTVFGVNREWLISGEGDMFTPPEDEAAAYVKELLGEEENPLYDLIKAIMKTYNSCGEKDKQVIKAFARAFKDNLNG